MWSIKMKCACGAAFEVEDELGHHNAPAVRADDRAYRDQMRKRARLWRIEHYWCRKVWPLEKEGQFLRAPGNVILEEPADAAGKERIEHPAQGDAS